MIACSIHKTLQSHEGTMQLDVSFEIEKGALVSISGASGAGKTTILRILAGLTNADKGFIQVQDEVWFDADKKINLAVQKRSIGFVFQDYALFPNMTVKENLLFPLHKNEPTAIVDELISIMDLGQLQSRKPYTLSGGQQQRVAVARALVRKPDLLLLDEPLSAIDVEMRLKLQDHLLKLHKQYGLTTILVSHDVQEMYKMSDEIFELKQGRLLHRFSSADVAGKNNIEVQLLHAEEINGKLVLTLERNGTVFKMQADKETGSAKILHNK